MIHACLLLYAARLLEDGGRRRGDCRLKAAALANIPALFAASTGNPPDRFAALRRRLASPPGGA